MSRFEQVWAGERETRLRAMRPFASPTDEAPAVVAFRAWAAHLMAAAGVQPTPRSVDLRKLRLTEGYREALRQAPQEQTALFTVWDAAYRVLERLHWELAPPAIDPPVPLPPPTYEDVRAQYKAMKRDRQRQAEARTTHWHPLEVTDAPAVSDDATE